MNIAFINEAVASLDAILELELYWAAPVNDISSNLLFLRHTIPVQICEPEKDGWISFLSNDYFGFSRHPTIISRASIELQNCGLSMCSSRVVGGTSTLHEQLEQRMAEFYSVESMLLFSSGYMANLGAISALVGRGDVLVIDRLCHASLYDAAVLSRAKVLRFRHNDVEDLSLRLTNLRERGKVRGITVVTESVFSMDGDEAPLRMIAQTCAEFGAKLLVDEAHAVKRASPATFEALHPSNFVRTFTLSKTFGSIGGAIGMSSDLRTKLVSTSRPFIFDTALSPIHVTGALAALELLEADESPATALLGKAADFRQSLNRAGFDTGKSTTQIIPLIVGNEDVVCNFRDRLYAQKILVGAIRSPSVPMGRARLRFGICTGHSLEALFRVADAVLHEGSKLGLV